MRLLMDFIISVEAGLFVEILRRWLDGGKTLSKARPVRACVHKKVPRESFDRLSGDDFLLMRLLFTSYYSTSFPICQGINRKILQKDACNSRLPRIACPHSIEKSDPLPTRITNVQQLFSKNYPLKPLKFLEHCAIIKAYIYREGDTYV